MHLAGTPLARSARMHERPVPTIPPVLFAPEQDAPGPEDEEIPASAAAPEIDKYDPATIACTD
jgi:hypothetical protein